ncbi:MAG: sulfatase/phosphatase domain-containing protein, partial [Phenylobacterium sp.]
YKDLDIKLPASAVDTPENRAGKPMWVQNQRNSWHGVDFAYHSSRDVADYFRDYYRTLSAVDDSVGRTLDYLRKHRLEKNTLIVFMSDNGFLMGEHGLIDKRNAYEPSVKVPMVAYAPGMLPKGAVNEARVRNLDVAPTLLDVAGAKAPPQFEGRSILPVASGKVAAKDWVEDDFVYEYYWEWTFPQTPTTFAIEHGKLKYIQYHGIWDLEELYDLSKDPGEMTNLIDDPDYLQAKIDLRGRLFARLANDKSEHVIPYSYRYSAGVVWRDKDGPKAADFPPQWQVAPDRPDRLNGAFPDSPAKAAADKAGRRYLWNPGR